MAKNKIFDIRSLSHFDVYLNDKAFPMHVRVVPFDADPDDKAYPMSYDFEYMHGQSEDSFYTINMNILREHVKKRDTPEMIVSVNPVTKSTDTYIVELVRIKSAKRLGDDQSNRDFVRKHHKRFTFVASNRKAKQKHYEQCLSVLTDEEMKTYEAFYKTKRPEDPHLYYIKDAFPAFLEDENEEERDPFASYTSIGCVPDSNTKLFQKFLKSLGAEKMHDINCRITKVGYDDEVAREKYEKHMDELKAAKRAEEDEEDEAMMSS